MQFVKVAFRSPLFREITNRVAYLQSPIFAPILNNYTGICKSSCSLNRKGSEIKL